MHTELFRQSLGPEIEYSRVHTDGVKTLLTLCRDNALYVFKHGDAAKLAKFLQDCGLNAARAKFYAEKTAKVVKAAHKVAYRETIGLRGDERKVAFKKSLTDFFASLEAKESVALIMEEIRQYSGK